MPLFAFGCEKCRAEYELYLPSYKDPFPPCPECQGPLVRLIAGMPGVSLKGTGWSTDNYSTTDRGMQAVSDKVDKKDRVVSFPGQLHKGR